MVAQFFSIDNQVPRSQCMNFFGWMDGWMVQSVSLPRCLVLHLVWMMYYVTTLLGAHTHTGLTYESLSCLLTVDLRSWERGGKRFSEDGLL